MTLNKPKYAVEMSTRLWPVSSNLDTTPADMPDSWEAMTRSQLEWQASKGTYGQQLIAGRYLRDWAKDHQ
jgi:hypothetical protein